MAVQILGAEGSILSWYHLGEALAGVASWYGGLGSLLIPSGRVPAAECRFSVWGTPFSADTIWAGVGRCRFSV